MSPTISSALTYGKQALQESDSPALDAQILLCELLGKDRVYLFTHPEEELEETVWLNFQQQIEQAQQGKPVAYIIGKRAFYDRELLVSPAVLIPRPETEILVEEAIAFARHLGEINIVDIGSGSGAIAICVKAHCPRATVYAIDVSPEALEIAQQNADLQEVEIHFHQGDLAEPLSQAGIKVHLLLANLPYIPSKTVLKLAVSQYEPHLALDGGIDGLELIDQLLKQCPLVCEDGALILMEIGADQGETALALAKRWLKTSQVSLIKDYAGYNRFLRILYNKEIED
ncbi:peptide chain release factor N(5)-glutamine methyltransferase [Anaerolineales bacterium]